MDTALRILQGDALEQLGRLPYNCVHCCVTSPPYWRLRDYGVEGQLGMEATPEEYIARLVQIFAQVRMVLRTDGTCWLNLGDSYGRGKQLLGIPWRVALALQADGWILRQDIVWHKPDTVPESVRDRCTRAHEYLFMLVKDTNYFYDIDAIREPHKWADDPRNDGERHEYAAEAKLSQASGPKKMACVAFHPLGRNRRSVWTVPKSRMSGDHLAPFPEELVRPCILAGCPEGGVVLDPFAGSGTTGRVALRTRRQAVLIELNPEYIPLIRERCSGFTPELL